jgi:transposase
MKKNKRISGAGSSPIQRRFTITAGLDTDKNFIVAGLYNEDSTHIITREFPQTHTGAAQCIQWLKAEGVQLVIIESTAQYHMLYYDAFRQAGMNIQVINPMLIKSLLRVEGKSDKGDASTLARLAASFTLRTSNMPDEQMRQIRLRMRSHDQIQSERTRLTNRLGAALAGVGVTIFRMTKLNSPSGRIILANLVDGMTAEEAVRQGWRGRKDETRIRELIESIPPEGLKPWIRDYVNDQLKKLESLNIEEIESERKILDLVNQFDLHNQILHMCTHPIVTPMLALRIIGELGNNYAERYHSADAIAKAVGVVPANQVSGGKLLKRKTSHGNIHVKRHLLQAVKSWCLHYRGSKELKEFAVSYKERAGYSKMISAVARKTIEKLWWMQHWSDVYREQSDLRHITPPPTAILLVMNVNEHWKFNPHVHLLEHLFYRNRPA